MKDINYFQNYTTFCHFIFGMRHIFYDNKNLLNSVQDEVIFDYKK